MIGLVGSVCECVRLGDVFVVDDGCGDFVDLSDVFVFGFWWWW